MSNSSSSSNISIQDLLNDSGLLISNLLEDSLNEIYIFDATTLKFILVNRVARKNLGYSMDELRSMTPFDIKPGHTEESFKEVISPLLTDEEQKIEFNTVHRRKDETDYLVEVHLQKTLLNDKSVLVAFILDITERTKNKLDLDKALTFLDSAPDAIIVVDESGKIIFSNQQMAELIGYTYFEMQNMNVDDLVPMRFRDGHSVHRANFSANSEVRGMGAGLELSAVTKEGREIPIEVSLSPIDTPEGKLISAAIRDTTEREAFEEQLRLAKLEAEEASVAKTRFLATASHDLRQPLQALRLYLSALTNKLDDPKAIQLGEKMNLSLDTMGELLDALLDIASLESGNVKVERRDIKLSELFDRIITDNSGQAKEKGLAFETEGLDSFVYSDPILLQRIIDNFITNAIRYTEQGKVSLKALKDNQNIVISVSDSGEGIAKEDQETIFGEFIQLDNAVRSSSKGLGLGLSIVKHIARLLEHPIKVTSEIGKGSCFSVEVPLSKNQLEVIEPETNLQSNRDVDYIPTVLIVDNEPTIVDAMYELLSMHDMNVVTAGHGAEALAHIQEGLEPDFVLTDYRMPEINGVQLVIKIRNIFGDALPVAIMTGDTSLEKIMEAKLANCSILKKPVKIDKLLSLITTV